MGRNLRQQSRDVQWTTTDDSSPSIEQINCGSLLRIADATEKMAASYDAMRESRDRYQRWYEQETESRHAAERRITALKGVITRLRRRRQEPTA